jgi:hypothetical protein
MTKIIALSGRKQSGKSTACEYIASTITNSTYKIYSFADPLKEDICMNILGLSYNQCYGSDEEKNSLTHLIWKNQQLTARDVMQIIGTEIFRSMYPDVWVNALINKILSDDLDIALICDCRFPNEVEVVRQHHGYVLRLTRDPFNSDHTSEKALDKNNYDWENFDFICDNINLTLEQKNKSIANYLFCNKILYQNTTSTKKN